MKYLLASLFFFSSTVFGQTIIDYPDGSTYTLEDNESVFVSNQAVYTKTTYKTGGVHFRPLEANTDRDFVPSATDGMEPGSAEWCEVYVPYTQGYSFNDQIWERACKDKD